MLNYSFTSSSSRTLTVILTNNRQGLFEYSDSSSQTLSTFLDPELAKFLTAEEVKISFMGFPGVLSNDANEHLYHGIVDLSVRGR